VTFIASLLPHLLAASLVVAVVGWPPKYARRASRLRHYWHTVCWQWLCVALLLIGGSPLDAIHLAGTTSAHGHPALWFIVLGNIVLIMYAPIAIAWISPLVRRNLLAYFVRVRAWLPGTPGERAAWIGLSLTTGICEELLFRGFVLRYLMHGPWAFGLPLSVGIACVVFGVGHRYQGRRGMLQTLCFGAFMSGLFIATGSLLLPIIVHILVNLRIALLPSIRAHYPPPLAGLRPPLVSS
jgi:membrane protease YdiL (CAAX protease family)